MYFSFYLSLFYPIIVDCWDNTSSAQLSKSHLLSAFFAETLHLHSTSPCSFWSFPFISPIPVFSTSVEIFISVALFRVVFLSAVSLHLTLISAFLFFVHWSIFRWFFYLPPLHHHLFLLRFFTCFLLQEVFYLYSRGFLTFGTSKGNEAIIRMCKD